MKKLLIAAMLGLVLAGVRAEPRLPRAPVAAASGPAAAPAARPVAASAAKPGAKSAAAPASSQGACDLFLARLPNVTRELCESAQLQDSGSRSVRGVPLFVRDLSPAQPKLRVLVVGAIHGDELSSAAVALHWLRLAGEEAVDMPQPVHWRFVPVLNPDGLLMRPARRTNANGVDLNRNFPTPRWEQDAPRYWQQRTRKDPRRYPGPSPLSEPESKFLHAQMASFQPHLIVAIHAPYGVLDFDGPSVPPSRLGRLYLDQVGIFPGSLGHYGGVHKGVPVVTIELPNAFRTPRDAETRQMWLDLLRWMATRLTADGGR